MKRTELLIEIIKSLIHIKRFHQVEEDVYFQGSTYKLHIFPIETRNYYSNIELYKKNEDDRFYVLCNVICAERNQKSKVDYTINHQLSIAYNYNNKNFKIRNQYEDIDELEFFDIKDEDYESKLFQLMLVQNNDINEVYDVAAKTYPLLQRDMEVHCRLLEADSTELEVILNELKNFILNKMDITIEEANER